MFFIFENNLNLAYSMVFLIGLSIFRSYSFLMLVVEISEKHNQVYITSFYLGLKTAISMFIPSFYFLFGGKNWKVPYAFPLILSPIILILCLFIPESPRFYYEKRKYKELRNLIRKFAESNLIKMDPNYDIDKEVKENAESQNTTAVVESKWFYLKQYTIFLNLVVVVMWLIFVSFDSYLISFHMKYIEGNLYFLTIVSAISDWCSTILAGFIQKLIGTKRTWILSFTIWTIFALPLLFFPNLKWVPPVSIFGWRWGLAIAFNMMYYVNSEIFPTLFVSFAFTIGNLLARTATIFAPEIAELPPPIPVQLLIISMILSIIAVVRLKL